jgi:hypothetical protein
MAAGEHLGSQFHEMTREQFEAQPGTWFHGTPTGIIGHAGSFHVGTKQAATEALRGEVGKPRWFTNREGKASYGSNPSVIGGRIVGPMANTPRVDPSRGPGDRWNYREGIPWGHMTEWSRRSPHEVMSDVRANAIESAIKTRGQTMRQGIYYVNAAEGANDPEKDPTLPVSAVLPNRQHFKTHEDYIIGARAQGKQVPGHVLQQYPHLGQGRLF